jgi:hypothetical protein
MENAPRRLSRHVSYSQSTLSFCFFLMHMHTMHCICIALSNLFVARSAPVVVPAVLATPMTEVACSCPGPVAGETRNKPGTGKRRKKKRKAEGFDVSGFYVRRCGDGDGIGRYNIIQEKFFLSSHINWGF